MNKPIADLHLHTTASDGEFSPVQIVEHAIARDLKAIAITDHDTVAGCAEAIDAASDKDLMVVTGAEWTATWRGRAYHFLGYDFSLDNSELQKLDQDQRAIRLERIQKLVSRLKTEFGISIPEEILKRDGVVCRSHLAKELREILSEKEQEKIWTDYLVEDSPCDAWPYFYTVRDVIHNAGGIIVLAHPGDRWRRKDLLYLQGDEVDGIEVFHPSHSQHTTRDLTAFAMSRGLVVTGGSDWHGVPGYHEMGTIGISQSLWKRFEKRLGLRL